MTGAQARIEMKKEEPEAGENSPVKYFCHFNTYTLKALNCLFRFKVMDLQLKMSFKMESTVNFQTREFINLFIFFGTLPLLRSISPSCIQFRS